MVCALLSHGHHVTFSCDITCIVTVTVTVTLGHMILSCALPLCSSALNLARACFLLSKLLMR